MLYKGYRTQSCFPSLPPQSDWAPDPFFFCPSLQQVSPNFSLSELGPAALCQSLSCRQLHTRLHSCRHTKKADLGAPRGLEGTRRVACVGGDMKNNNRSPCAAASPAGTPETSPFTSPGIGCLRTPLPGLTWPLFPPSSPSLNELDPQGPI